MAEVAAADGMMKRREGRVVGVGRFRERRKIR
jgi:hypothetical protein